MFVRTCPIPSGFRDRAIWMYNRRIVDKKEILRVRTVSNTGIYCSSDRVGTVYNKCLKIPPSTSMHFATRVKTWRVVRLNASWSSFMQAITSSVLTSYYCLHKGTSRRTQTNNTPCLHTSYKVHWCWQWNFWTFIINCTNCHLNNKYRY